MSTLQVGTIAGPAWSYRRSLLLVVVLLLLLQTWVNAAPSTSVAETQPGDISPAVAAMFEGWKTETKNFPAHSKNDYGLRNEVATRIVDEAQPAERTQLRDYLLKSGVNDNRESAASSLQAALLWNYIDHAEREQLTSYLAGQCPRRLFMTHIESAVVSADRLTDPFLIFCDAFDTSKSKANGSEIAAVVRAAVYDVVDEEDDSKLVSAVRTWYGKSRQKLTINETYGDGFNEPAALFLLDGRPPLPASVPLTDRSALSESDLRVVGELKRQWEQEVKQVAADDQPCAHGNPLSVTRRLFVGIENNQARFGAVRRWLQTAPAKPMEPESFEWYALNETLERLATSRQRGKLLLLLATRAPDKVYSDTLEHVVCAGSEGQIDDPFLVLCDAFDLSNSPEERHILAHVVQRALGGIVTGSDADIVRDARQWYLNNSKLFTLNDRYTNDDGSHRPGEALFIPIAPTTRPER